MRRNIYKVCIFPLVLLLFLTYAKAEELDATPAEDQVSSRDTTEGIFRIRAPNGFKRETVDEAGIYKWKKDSGEIYLVRGDLFLDSGDMLFKAMRKSAEKNKDIQEVKTLRLKGGKAILYKEKPPEDPGRLRSWRLVVIADKKIINVDFTAPARDFESFIPAFEEAVKSFKLSLPPS